MSVAEIKSRMVTILNGGNAWCKGSNAVDSNESPVSALSPDAVKWDLYGALWKANFEWSVDNNQTDPINWSVFHQTYNAIKDAVFPGWSSETFTTPANQWNFDFELWNDSADWSDVLAVLS